MGESEPAIPVGKADVPPAVARPVGNPPYPPLPGVPAVLAIPGVWTSDSLDMPLYVSLGRAISPERKSLGWIKGGVPCGELLAVLAAVAVVDTLRDCCRCWANESGGVMGL